MVTSVTNTPYSYLSQLQGAPAASPAASSGGSGASATPAANEAANSQTLVSSLLGNGATAFTPEILSLLQPGSGGNFDPISTLFGGAANNNALTKLYSDLYSTAASASVQTAKDNNPASVASGAANPVQNLIAAQAKASLAYNQTLLQSAQAASSANSSGAGGVTPLVT